MANIDEFQVLTSFRILSPLFKYFPYYVRQSPIVSCYMYKYEAVVIIGTTTIQKTVDKSKKRETGMMKKNVEMPEVMKCEAMDCSYNREGACHAKGITIGNMSQQLCDTMWTSAGHTERMDTAGVGACRSADCMHNKDLECQADGIQVIINDNQACCGTFHAQ